jgi:hypothetical protein
MVIIKKDPGNPRIECLRVIHLFEADYNLVLKQLWLGQTIGVPRRRQQMLWKPRIATQASGHQCSPQENTFVQSLPYHENSITDV